MTGAVGFAGVSSNIGHEPRTTKSGSVSAAATTPASVTINGRAMPCRAASILSSPTAPTANNTSVRHGRDFQ